VKYETQLSSITGAEIKAKIPNFNPSYNAFGALHIYFTGR